MPVKIKNLTNRLVSLRLNSGRTLHLPPKFLSNEIEDALVMNNAKVEKLKEKQTISVEKLEEVRATTSRPRSKKASEGSQELTHNLEQDG